MDYDEREHVATVVNFLWGKGSIKPHEVNESVARLTYQVFEEAQKCSASMDYLTQTTYMTSFASVLKELVEIGGRIAFRKETEIYHSCRNFAARNFRRKLDMAKQGVL